MAQLMKPRQPKGMRDFLPDDLLKRQYVIDIVTEVFETFGFEPLYTPALELRQTLHGNLGQDAEKQIFYAQHPNAKEELALRYDLTVPLARVVAQYEGRLQMPFRRYHIGPVWRAERPQKGRYREFFQCDVDIVGVSSMAADAEIISLVVMVLQRLGFPQFEVRINNRKLLNGIGEYVGVPEDQRASLYRSVDKLDKIGVEGVQKELSANGIPDEAISRMLTLLEMRGGLDGLRELQAELSDVPLAQEGLAELFELAEYLTAYGVPADHYAFDAALVRGLGYYTGPVYETVITSADLGSVSGGGRYDELVGMFRKQSIPTTGVALGIERIIDLMDTLELYPSGLNKTVVQTLVTVFGDETRPASLAFANQLRQAGIRTEVHLERRKVGKQAAYADRKGIPVVAFLGGDEIANGVVQLKRLSDGETRTVPQAEAAATIRELLG